MYQIYVGCDWHLYSNKYDARHPYRTARSIGRLADNYGYMIDETDIFIFLGDLCDLQVCDKKKLAQVSSVIHNIKGYKLMCRGNHDLFDDDVYLDLGFDEICDIATAYGLVFSHVPVRVMPNEVNIHAHLHHEKVSSLGYQHINAYSANFQKEDQPILVDTLLKEAPIQDIDYNEKWNKEVTEQFKQYTAIRDDVLHSKIIDISDKIPLYPVDETSAEMNEILFPDTDSTKYWEADDNTYQDELDAAEYSDARKPHKVRGKNDVFAESASGVVVDLSPLIGKNTDKMTILSKDIFDNFLRIAPEALDKEKIKTARNAQDLIDMFNEMVMKAINTAYKQDGHLSDLDSYTAGLHILAMIYAHNNGVITKKTLKKVSPDLIPLDLEYSEFDSYIREVVDQLTKIEEYYINMVEYALTFIGFGYADSVNTLRNLDGPKAIKLVKKYVDKNEAEFVKTHSDGTIQYDFRHIHLNHVYIAPNLTKDKEYANRIKPSRYIERANRFNYCIFAHADSYIKDGKKLWTIPGGITIDGKRFERIDDIVRYLNPRKNRILIMSCNPSHIEPDDEVFSNNVEYAKNNIILESSDIHQLSTHALLKKWMEYTKHAIKRLNKIEEQLLTFIDGLDLIVAPNMIQLMYGFKLEHEKTDSPKELRCRFADSIETSISEYMKFLLSSRIIARAFIDKLNGIAITECTDGYGWAYSYNSSMYSSPEATHDHLYPTSYRYSVMSAMFEDMSLAELIPEVSSVINPLIKNEKINDCRFDYVNYTEQSSSNGRYYPIYTKIQETGLFDTDDDIIIESVQEYKRTDDNKPIHDNKESKEYAEKYGIRHIGHEDPDEKDPEEIERLKKAKQLQRARAIKKRKKVINKVKQHLPFVKNEDATAVDSSDIMELDLEHSPLYGDRKHFFYNYDMPKETNTSAEKLDEMAYEDYCDHFYAKLKSLANEYNKCNDIFKHAAKVLKMDQDKLPKFDCHVEVSSEKQLCFSMINPDTPFEIRCEYEKYLKEMIAELEKDKETKDKYPYVTSIWTADAEGSIYINLDYENMNEVTTKMNDMTRIIALNDELNDYQYGLSRDNQKIKKQNTTSEDYDKYYRVATPAQFVKQNGGICWDFATYEASVFKKQFPNIKFKTYYIIFDAAPYYPTHTFLVFEKDMKFYYFESSFKRVQGIWVTNSISDIFNFVLHSMDQYRPKDCKASLLKYKYAIFEYNALHPDIPGSTTVEFMNLMEEIGQEIPHIYNPKRAENLSRLHVYTEPLYRITYNDIGIYEAYKKLCSFDEWRSFIKSDAATWLDVPKIYNNDINHTSYFTKRGYELFQKNTYPVIIQKLNKRNIKVDQVVLSINPVYEDLYQVVVPNSVNESSIQESYDIVYHGSPMKFTKLIPKNNSHEDHDYVFGTPDRNFALCYAGNPWNDFIINQSYINGKLTLIEIEPNAFKQTFDRAGYIYTLPAKDFTITQSSHKVMSDHSVIPISVKQIPNIYQELKRSGVKLYPYGTWPKTHIFKTREEYLADRKAHFDQALQESYQFELLDKNVHFYDKIDETASYQAKGKLYPVYVMLVHSGTTVSNLIKSISHSEYSHASISFDSSLDHMYSFARKDPKNPFLGGFRYESIGKGFYDKKEIPYALYVVPCTEDQVKRMKKRLDYFVKNNSKFSFDFAGLVKNYIGYADEPEYRWFCSRFVADILNAGSPEEFKYIDEPSLMDPDDFKKTNFARFVIAGDNMMKYDRKLVDKLTKKILIEEKYRKQTGYTLAEDVIDPTIPYEDDILVYQLLTMDESVVDDVLKYLQSFKIKFDQDGNVIIHQREYKELSQHFNKSKRMLRHYRKTGATESIKNELCKLYYMINIIETYYLKPTTNAKYEERQKQMMDLRALMINVFRQNLNEVTAKEPNFNFQSYYNASDYGKDLKIPKTVIAATGKALVTMLS